MNELDEKLLDKKLLDKFEEILEEIGRHGIGLDVMELPEGQELTLQMSGKRFYAKGRGYLFIAYFPPEALEEPKKEVC